MKRFSLSILLLGALALSGCGTEPEPIYGAPGGVPGGMGGQPGMPGAYGAGGQPGAYGTYPQGGFPSAQPGTYNGAPMNGGMNNGGVYNNGMNNGGLYNGGMNNGLNNGQQNQGNNGVNYCSPGVIDAYNRFAKDCNPVMASSDRADTRACERSAQDFIDDYAGEQCSARMEQSSGQYGQGGQQQLINISDKVMREMLQRLGGKSSDRSSRKKSRDSDEDSDSDDSDEDSDDEDYSQSRGSKKSSSSGSSKSSRSGSVSSAD